MSTWYLLDCGPSESAFNMALDEALLEAMPQIRRPVLRFYGWTQPAASFGYFQKFSETEQLTTLRPLIRRPTGGGLVPHAADWTYSLVSPPDSEWYSLTAMESYRRVHEWLQAAFTLLGIVTQLAPEPRTGQAGQCFVGCEKSDLLWQGNKIAGAAQRRRRDGLLVQGSVQPPRWPLARADWQQAICKTGRTLQNITWQKLELDETLISRVDSLVQQKYSQQSYNQRR